MRSSVALLVVAACLCGAEYVQQRLSRGPEGGGGAQRLTSYLEELQKYYTVYGRGRYGKRHDNAVPYKETPVYQPYPAAAGSRWNIINDIE